MIPALRAIAKSPSGTKAGSGPKERQAARATSLHNILVYTRGSIFTAAAHSLNK
jgi:hypothetical protein